MLRPSTSATSLGSMDSKGDASTGSEGLYDWTAPRFGGLSVASEPKPELTLADGARFPEFRPDDGSLFAAASPDARRRRPAGAASSPGAQQRAIGRPAAAAPAPAARSARSLVGPLVNEFADAVAREIGERVRATLDAEVGSDRLERFLASDRTCPRCAAREKGAAPAPAPSPPAPPPDEGSLNDVRQGLAGALAKLSTLEGRQRAIQGKMAKLDGQWGGDFSNVTHAVAELQRVVASHQYAVADLGALRGNLIALAHSVDALEKRTAAKNGETPPPAPAAPAAEDGAAEGGV